MRRSAAPSKSSLKTSSKVILPNLTKRIITENSPINPSPATSTTRSTRNIIDILKTVNPSNENNGTSTEKCADNSISQVSGKTIYNVVWGKRSTKKHKVWQGDGILEVNKTSATLKDDAGQILGRASNLKTTEFESGFILLVGSKEVQILDVVSQVAPGSGKVTESEAANKKRKNNSGILSMLSSKRIKGSILEFEPLVMPYPPPVLQWEQNENQTNVVEVNVDPILARVLRPHQREGVTFLYKCALGFHGEKWMGSILADEMGLGKTLQCITLAWVLLNRSPFESKPVVQKILIITPSSLVCNWQAEFKKWLGQERIRTFVVDSKNKPQNYINLTHVPVMIISYEMFVRYFEDIKNIKFDLLICDEGHRLKNANIKASTLLREVQCRRRILLTGTPIQNDLQEFYALVNFVNPGILGSEMEYRSYFEDAIKASREPDADEEVQLIGENRAAELNKKTSFFILRRTQALNTKYLPSKHEIIIYCKISNLQKQLYEAAIDFWESRAESTIDDTEVNTTALSVITALKKICNHPSLISPANDSEMHSREPSNLIKHLQLFIPEWEEMSLGDSGKLEIVDSVLKSTIQNNEKIILVSNFTQTLNLLEGLCDNYEYKYCRLDGSTPSNQRVDLVNKFNNAHSDINVFLLSARAGGVGLNLTGASRLILYDADWNPATDLQAMSRIWRDGQANRNVYIYRLITAATIEEKIFQRQIFKTGLSGAVVDQQQNSVRLSAEELKELFTMNWDTDCLTHDSLLCECNGNGSIPVKPVDIATKTDEPRECQLGNSEHADNGVQLNELDRWEHHSQPFDTELLSEYAIENITGLTFIFRNKYYA